MASGTTSTNTPDLNSLSKSPSELIEFENVCFDTGLESVDSLYYKRDEESHHLEETTIVPDDSLDQQLEELLDNTKHQPLPLTHKHLPLPPLDNCSHPSHFTDNTDELDSMLDELLN